MSRRLHDLSENSKNLNVLRFRRRQPAEDTFAVYFAKYLVGRRGFQFIDLPELRPLAAACDYLLVRTDGFEFKVVAIVDRDARPDAQFHLSARDVHEIGKTCTAYTGSVSGNNFPVYISIYEIGSEGDANEAISRLRPIHDETTSTAVRMQAWLVDTQAKRIWTNKQFAFLGWQQSMERLLRSPRLTDREFAPEPAVWAKFTLPWITGAIIALLIAIFCLEAFRSGSGLSTPPAAILSAFGGLSRSVVLDSGEWWRLFTAPLLHADIIHLGLNCLSIGLMGLLLENFVGWRWTLAGFAFCAGAGALASLFLLADSTVSVGASGGAVGLAVMTFIVAVKRLPYGQERTLIGMWTLGALIPALLPLAGSFASRTPIDYGSHFGGAAGGVLLGLLVLRLWPAQKFLPSGSNAAGVLGAAWFVVGIGALALRPLFRL